MGKQEPDDAAPRAAPDAGHQSGRRERLVLAGLMELDDLPLAKVFSGATTAAIARRAGVTTGSYFHHFGNAAEFTDAIATSFLDIPQDVTETIEQMQESLHQVDLVGVMQSDLNRAWKLFMSDERVQMRFRLQMQLWAHHGKELSSPVDGCRTVGDVLLRNYGYRQDETVALWRFLLDKTGRRLLPPFTVERLAVALTSLFQGLAIRSAVDGEHVDDNLFADVVIALAAALTVPLGGRIRLSDLSVRFAEDPDLSPQARTGARRRRETRSRITAASAELFTRGWEAVSTTEVAEAAGVSPQTVINLFPSVRSVAASVFARHVPTIRAVATGETQRAGDAPEGPLDRLHATLTHLAECVAADPEPARALHSERLQATLHAGGDITEDDIRVQVPLAESILHAIDGLDIGDVEPIEITRTLIDFVLSHGLGRPNRESETAMLAIRLLPDSALGDPLGPAVGAPDSLRFRPASLMPNPPD